MERRILVVDDNERSRRAMARMLEAEGRLIETAGDVTTALELLVESDHALVLVDLNLGGLTGFDLLEEIRRLGLPVLAVVMTANPPLETVTRAMKLGAYDVIDTPCDPERLELLVEKALNRHSVQGEVLALRRRVPRRYAFDKLLGKSRGMREILHRVAKVAAARCTVLVTGETGTGKELVAESIHYNDRTRTGPLVAVNCAAIPETLIESELFGHEKGAFTNADRRRIGRFEQAQGGTLLLDEIGSLPPSLQAKLLRVLQDGSFERVGGQETIRVETRVIASTNEDLAKAVSEGRFREDLFYRLNVVSLVLPPLRERLEDLPLLVDHFLQALRERGFPPRRISQAVLDRLMEYDWPGNVRELEHAVEQMAISSIDETIEVDAIPSQIVPTGKRPFSLGFDLERPLAEITSEITERLEREYLTRVLKKYNGRIEPSAKHCGVSRRSISEKLRRYGIDKADFKPHLARKSNKVGA